nr:hypothetical protein [Tanacetum cinerariifolium]
MSAKRTSWNEFSSSMASAVICLSTGYEKGCSRVETPLFEGMIVAPQASEGAAEGNVDDVPAAGVAIEGAASVNVDDVLAAVDEPSILSPTPPTQPPPLSQDIPSTSQDISKDVVVDAEIEENADDDDIEPTELHEVVEVVTTAKLITEVLTAASAIITAVSPQLTIAAIPTLTTAHSAAIRRKGVVIRDPKETATPSTIIHSEAKSKDKGKRILRKEKEDNAIMRHQTLKRKPQTEAQARKNMMIYMRNMAGFKMDYFKGMKYNDIHPIFKKYFKSNVAFLEKTKEQMEEEDGRALKKISKSKEDKAAKKQKLDEEDFKEIHQVIKSAGKRLSAAKSG